MGIWTIADANHDSENTGQNNCYDLISDTSSFTSTFGGVNYPNSTVRSYINSTIYNQFGSIKSYIIPAKYYYYYKSGYSVTPGWYSDYVFLPSFTELNCKNGGSYDNKNLFADGTEEGKPYPIFSGDSSRIKGSKIYWLRTMYNTSWGSYGNVIGCIASDGKSDWYTPNYTYNIYPIIRVSLS